MGSLNITASFIDYSNGSTWASLGVNQTAAQQAVQQACQDYSSGLGTFGSNVNITIKFGLGAVGTTNGDTAGNAVISGATNFAFINSTPSYSAWRSLLLAYGSPNSIQQSAWNITNLPPSPFNVTWSSTFLFSALSGAIGGTYSDGQVAGCCGIAVGYCTNYDQHGIGAASFYGAFAHEISEILGRRADGAISSSNYPLDNWLYSSAGVREVSFNPRYTSHDGGVTDVADMFTNPAGDAGDFNPYGNDSYDGSGPSSGSVSRSSTVPLQQRDWQVMTIIGWPLTPLGKQWAGITSVGVGLVGLRR